jgi:hypothetical protein
MFNKLLLFTLFMIHSGLREWNRGSVAVSIVSRDVRYLVIAGESRNYDPKTKQSEKDENSQGQQPSPSPNQTDSPQNPPPSAEQPVSLLEHLRRGDPPAYSAIAAIVAVFCTVIVALLTLWLSYIIRRGQIAQEQVKMVLEIDSELIKSPDLWVVHGKKYVPVPESTDAIASTLKKVAASAKETEQAATAALEAIKTRPTVAPATGTGYTSQELRQLALVARYFNMFDFIYSAIGRSRLKWTRGDEWKAWKNYMRDFFDDNAIALRAWNEFNQSKLYTESFKKFVEDEILNKKPE